MKRKILVCGNFGIASHRMGKLATTAKAMSETSSKTIKAVENFSEVVQIKEYQKHTSKYHK